MVRFVERRWSPARTVLSIAFGCLFMPLVGAALLITERTSLPGFVMVVAVGAGVSFVLSDWMERRNPRVSEIQPGKAAANSPRDQPPDPFPEAVSLPILIAMSVAMGVLLLGNGLLVFLIEERTKSNLLLLPLIPAALVVVVLWISQVRLIVSDDEILAVHPWFRLIPDRRFRFADIDTVESDDAARGARRVAIKLRDGTTIRYVADDPKTIDRLLRTVAAGVARAKPRSPDLDELL